MNPSVAPLLSGNFTPSRASRWVLGVWRGVAGVVLPFYVVAYHLHAWRQTETRTARKARLKDLLGYGTTLKKSESDTTTAQTITLWVHAVSAGELTAGLRLIERLVAFAEEKNTPAAPWRVLVTTTTLSSARTAERFLPQGADHRFLPLDAPRPVARFLHREQVRLGILIESEIWPTLAHRCLHKQIPVLVASARLSPRSFARAQRHPFLARSLYSLPTLFLARHPQEVQVLENLGARKVQVAGELKDSARPPPVAQEVLEKFQAQLRGLPCWLAVSTHRDETEAVIATHKGLVEAGLTDVITLLCPRRPFDKTLERILFLLEASGVPFTRRSLNQDLPTGGGIYLCDSFGEVGLWCSLAAVAFVGGSLVDHGGHNPREPAWFSCALFMGPHFHNQRRAVEALRTAGGLEVVETPQQLTQGVAKALKESTEKEITEKEITETQGTETRSAKTLAGTRAYSLVAQQGETALNQTFAAIKPFLDALE